MKLQVPSLLRSVFFVTSLLVISLPALALKTDTQQPIHVDSVKQALDMQNNTVTFSDHVVVTQGSIEIKADKVVVTRPGGDQNKTIIEAFGNPATFYQMQDDGKPVKGNAQAMRYEVANEFMTLTGHAYLEQLDSNVKGDRITYLIKQQQMEAFSDKGKRVTTVLVPGQLQDKNAAGKTSHANSNAKSSSVKDNDVPNKSN